MLPKNLPKIFRWPEMCPLGKILAEDFQMAAFTKILGRRDKSVVPLLSMYLKYNKNAHSMYGGECHVAIAKPAANSRLCELRIDYLIEDGRGPQWRPESAETFIFRNTLWPSGRFLRGIFSKNYLGWRGTKISLKISSGAQSENLEPSLTIQELKNIYIFLVSMQRMCTLFG